MKKAFLIILFLSISQFTSAQLNSSITLSGGIVEKKESYGFMVNYNYSSNNSNYEIGVLHSIFKKAISSEIDVEFSNTTLQAGYLHTLIRSRDNSISINFGLGVFGGYTSIAENNNVIITSENGPAYGAYGVGQLDFYTSDNFAFILRAQENYYVESETGDFNPYIAFGLKFNF